MRRRVGPSHGLLLYGVWRNGEKVSNVNRQIMFVQLQM